MVASRFFLRRSGRGRVSSQKLGDLCASAPSLQADSMPPRMTQESCRPRVSDRTMVGNSATTSACEFQRTEWRHHAAEHETTGRKRHRSAAYLGGWMSENISGGPAGRSVFQLTSPFIGLLAPFGRVHFHGLTVIQPRERRLDGTTMAGEWPSPLAPNSGRTRSSRRWA